MIAMAEAKKIPTQVAFNRRHVPLLGRLKSLFSTQLDPSEIHHISYDFCRIARRDSDFSTTIIHCIDTCRHVTGSDFREVEFRYQDLPSLGPTVLNIFMDGVLESGATAHINFCPFTGVVIERLTLHTAERTIFLRLPTLSGLDAPGALVCVRDGETEFEITGDACSESQDPEYLEGFYGENESFFEDIRHGRLPRDDLQSTRQSLIVAQCVQTRQATCSL